MPNEARDTPGVVFKNGTVTLLARVVGADGTAVYQSLFSPGGSSSSSGECDLPASYSIYLLDEQDPDSRTAVAGHQDVEVAIADLIFDALQTDDLWDVDDTGYNFRHTIDICPDDAFGIAGRKYLVEFRLQPSGGDVILVRFVLRCI